VGQRWGNILDGEGILEPLHARLQVLNLPRLLGQEQVFYALKSGLHLCAKLFDVCLAGRRLESLVDHVRQDFNGGDGLFHMYSSIAGLLGVSMAGVGLRRSLLVPNMGRKLPMFASPTLIVCGPLHVVILPSSNGQRITAKVLGPHAVWEPV